MVMLQQLLMLGHVTRLTKTHTSADALSSKSSVIERYRSNVDPEIFL